MGPKNKVYTFEGQAVDVDGDGRLCIHVGECTRAKGGLFASGRDPWGQLPAPTAPIQVIRSY